MKPRAVRSWARALLLAVSLGPTRAYAGEPIFCETVAECPGAGPRFCVRYPQDARGQCVPGFTGGLGANGRPACEARGLCWVVDARPPSARGYHCGTQPGAPGPEGAATFALVGVTLAWLSRRRPSAGG